MAVGKAVSGYGWIRGKTDAGIFATKVMLLIAHYLCHENIGREGNPNGGFIRLELLNSCNGAWNAGGIASHDGAVQVGLSS